MAKQAGLGDAFYVDGYDLSSDIGAVDTVGGGPSPIEVTGIDKSAKERLGAIRDGRIEFTSFFNPAAGRSHDRLSNLPTSDVIVTYFRGTTLGNEAACLVAKQIDYNPTRGEDGSLTFKTAAQANGFGLEWGRNLGLLLQGGAGNGTGVDFTAASAFGLQAYLHIDAFTGTSVVVKLQESSDNGSGDAYTDVTGGAFTSATGITSERIATSPTLAVERWLRVVTTGTFSALAFAVVVARNLTAVVL